MTYNLKKHQHLLNNFKSIILYLPVYAALNYFEFFQFKQDVIWLEILFTLQLNISIAVN